MTEKAKNLTGTIRLENTRRYPFNDSRRTVALERSLDDNDYTVSVEVTETDGETGDIIVSGRAVNGFKLEFTGSARTVTVACFITGGVADAD